MEKYNKFITFLNALETGLDVEIKGRTYSMGLDHSDMPRIAHKMTVINSESGEERTELMQGLDLPDINNFIIFIINNMSDDEVTSINADIALNKIKKND
jgi:hypothetical protein